MVKVKVIELPIQFSRNLPSIAIHFGSLDDTNSTQDYLHLYGTTIDIELQDRNNPLYSWSYTHLVQSTNIVHLTGVDYGNYSIVVKPHSPDTTTIDMPYTIMCQNQIFPFPHIENTNQEETTIINVVEQSGNSEGTRFNAFSGALLTSGSFTMMASSAF